MNWRAADSRSLAITLYSERNNVCEQYCEHYCERMNSGMIHDNYIYAHVLSKDKISDIV